MSFEFIWDFFNKISFIKALWIFSMKFELYRCIPSSFQGRLIKSVDLEGKKFCLNFCGINPKYKAKTTALSLKNPSALWAVKLGWPKWLKSLGTAGTSAFPILFTKLFWKMAKKFKNFGVLGCLIAVEEMADFTL